MHAPVAEHGPAQLPGGNRQGTHISLRGQHIEWNTRRGISGSVAYDNTKAQKESQ